jgi:hypothetical protein
MRPRSIWVTCTFLVFLVACQSGQGSNVPKHLLGVWKTTHPKYADRFFEIRNDRILIFGTGDGAFELHALEEIEVGHEEGFVLYRLTHLNHHGQRYTLALLYEPAHGGLLRFKNQRDVAWKKEDR